MKKSVVSILALTALATSAFADASASNTDKTNCTVAAPAIANASSNDQNVTPAATLADEVYIGNILNRLSLSASVGYESEYVFRGIHCAGSSVVPEVDAAYDLGYGFGLYAGFWENYEVNHGNYNEIDIYSGVTYTFKALTFDLGYLAYLYPDGGENTDHEIKAGVSFDTTEYLGEDYAVTPFANYYYNFTTNVNTFEVGLEYSAPVTKWINGSEWGTLEFSGYYGYVAREAGNHDYGYVGFNAGAKVRVFEYCSVYAGMRYSHASGGAISPDEDYNTVWFGTAIGFGF